ncbi:MAG: hypothetical protein HC809_05915 [Gammaproteobacteria bacterium]|nr:hypothetical protein [Gammaproteobacteria bacterium]
MRLRLLAVGVFGALLVACGESADHSEAPVSAATPERVDDYVPARDFVGVDVCALVAGESVAKAANATLVSTETDVDTASCVYLVREGDAPYEVAVHVSLMGDAGSFVIGRNMASSTEPVADLGDDAYVKKAVGSQQQVFVERRDGLYVQVVAEKAEYAIAVARLFLAAIPPSSDEHAAP